MPLSCKVITRAARPFHRRFFRESVPTSRPFGTCDCRCGISSSNCWRRPGPLRSCSRDRQGRERPSLPWLLCPDISRWGPVSDESDFWFFSGKRAGVLEANLRGGGPLYLTRPKPLAEEAQVVVTTS